MNGLSAFGVEHSDVSKAMKMPALPKIGSKAKGVLKPLPDPIKIRQGINDADTAFTEGHKRAMKDVLNSQTTGASQ